MVLQQIKTELGKVFKSREELDLTSGDIKSNLFYLSLPIVILNLLRTTYNITDAIWLGNYSTKAFAAVTFGFPLVFFFISLGMGLAVAGSVLVAQFKGSGNREMVDYAASQTVMFGTVASVILGIIGFFTVNNLLQLLGASGTVLAQGTAFLQIISSGLIFMFGFAVFISLMRGFGDTITPMLLMLLSVGLNVILDPLLIFGVGFFPELGVVGAAIATVFCRGLAFLVGLYILATGREGIKISLDQMKPDLSFFKRMLSLGVPASIEGTGRSISVNALVAIVGMYSHAVVSGYGVGVRVFSMIFLPAIAVDRGVETMTGQNAGANNFDRIKKINDTAAIYMFAILSFLGVVTFLYPETIASVFSNDPEVVSTGADFLRVTALSFGFMGILRSYTGGFRGVGRTMVAAAIAVATLGVIRLPIAFIGSEMLGAKGIWYAFPASNVLGAFIAFAWFYRGSWKQNVLEEGEARGRGERFFERLEFFRFWKN